MTLSTKQIPENQRCRLHPSCAMFILVMVVNEVYTELGYTCIITSGADSHTTGLHPLGKALDFRTMHIRLDIIKQQIRDAIAGRLGKDYDIILEHLGESDEHLHCEFDPKTPIGVIST